jgi:hypothetical protein
MRHFSRSVGLGFAALAAGLIIGADALAAPTNGFRVLHHESVAVSSKKGVGANERMSFEAYGRRFDLTLAPNERIRRALPAGATKTEPLQGSVDGIPGSWVRVTRSPSGLRGMLFDGQQMYAIEPAADVAAVAVQPL